MMRATSRALTAVLPLADTVSESDEGNHRAEATVGT
jgi:hypothetical protein